jgi:hypothetical protein
MWGYGVLVNMVIYSYEGIATILPLLPAKQGWEEEEGW